MRALLFTWWTVVGPPIQPLTTTQSMSKRLPSKVDLRSMMPPVVDQGELGSSACAYPSFPVTRATPAKKYGALIDELLDHAFNVLQHDTGEHDPEWHHQREALA